MRLLLLILLIPQIALAGILPSVWTSVGSEVAIHDESVMDWAAYSLYFDADKYGAVEKANYVDLDCTRATTTQNAQNETVPIDTACFDAGVLRSVGVVENKITSPQDMTGAGWGSGGSPVITATTFTATAQDDYRSQAISTTEGTYYTFSFLASIASGGQTSNYLFRHTHSASGPSTALTLSETPTPYEATVLGRVGDGNVYFSFQDHNTSNWAKVTITDFQVTESGYKLPDNMTGTAWAADNDHSFAIESGSELEGSLDGVADGVELFSTFTSLGAGWSNDGGGVYSCDGSQSAASVITTPIMTADEYCETKFDITVSAGSIDLWFVGVRIVDNLTTGSKILRGTPDADGGYGFVASADFVGSISGISLKPITPAKGTIEARWIPQFGYDVDLSSTTLTRCIATCNGVNYGLLYYVTDSDWTTKGQFRTYDGTTLADISKEVSANQPYLIRLIYGSPPADIVSKYSLAAGQFMQLQVSDDEGETWTVSTPVVFDGSWNPGDTFSLGYDNDYWQGFDYVTIAKEATGWE